MHRDHLALTSTKIFDVLGLLYVGIFLTKSTSMPDGEYLVLVHEINL